MNEVTQVLCQCVINKNKKKKRHIKHNKKNLTRIRIV